MRPLVENTSKVVCFVYIPTIPLVQFTLIMYRACCGLYTSLDFSCKFMFKHTCLCVRWETQTHTHTGVKGDLGGGWGWGVVLVVVVQGGDRN